MRKLLLSALAVCFMLPAAAKKKEGKKESVAEQLPVVQLVTAEDSASYALGITMGAQVRDNLSKEGYSLDLFFKAFTSSMFFDDGQMSKDSADAFLNAYQAKLYERALDSLRSEQNDFLAANSKAEGVITTASGLQYRVVRMGEGPKPSIDDKVGVNYVGSLITGTVFDRQTDKENPVELELSQVIKGWTEGLQLMPVGSKFTFYIPSDLAYGDRGAGNVVPPYATLIFEVELLYISDK